MIKIGTFKVQNAATRFCLTSVVSKSSTTNEVLIHERRDSSPDRRSLLSLILWEIGISNTFVPNSSIVPLTVVRIGC